METKKMVYGIGINDADYAVRRFETVSYVDGKQKRKLVWSCTYYNVWVSMIKRCYSIKNQEHQPTYIGCSVATEWHLFSKFKAWMEKQDWEGKELDKDLLFEGNKVYGPNTCVFITPVVNKFANDHGASRGEWLIGACWIKEKAKFKSQCCNPFTKRQEHIGYFASEQEAHEAWLKRKFELAHELAAIQTDPRVAEALINRYSNYKTSGQD